MKRYLVRKPVTYTYDRVERRAEPGDVVDPAPKLRQAESWLLRQDAVEIIEEEKQEGG